MDDCNPDAHSGAVRQLPDAWRQRDVRQSNTRQTPASDHCRAQQRARHITSDGGLTLLHEVDRRWGVLKRFARCFRDHRAPDLISHPVEHLLRQRVFGIACGYEDLDDHDALREDPVLRTADIDGAAGSLEGAAPRGAYPRPMAKDEAGHPSGLGLRAGRTDGHLGDKSIRASW